MEGVRRRERPACVAVPAEARLAELQAVDAEAVREGAAPRRGEDGHGIPVQVLRSEHGETGCAVPRLPGAVEKRGGRARCSGELRERCEGGEQGVGW